MNKKVFIGVGHGGNDPGACANGLRESDSNLMAALACMHYLKSYNIVVRLSRQSDENDSISEEVKECNAFNPDLAVDFHTNSGGGDGFEIFHYSKGGISKTLATNIEKEVVAIGQNSRGLKTRIGNNGKEYYAFIRDVAAPSVIAEMAFIDNLKDINDFNEQHELNQYGEAIARGILNTLDIPIKEEIKGTPIIAAPTATSEQCKAWAKSKNAKQTFIDNAGIYFKLCRRSGVNPVIAYAQYAKETGYGKFGGVLDETFKNPCRLKETNSGKEDCHIADAHKRFTTWEDGIDAHIDHLALYAGANEYPRTDTLDPRHFSYLLGKSKTVEALSGQWAPSSTYGNDLVRMMKEIESIKIEAVDEHEENVNVLCEAGITISPEAWKDKSKINPDFVPGLIKNMADYIREIIG